MAIPMLPRATVRLLGRALLVAALLVLTGCLRGDPLERDPLEHDPLEHNVPSAEWFVLDGRTRVGAPTLATEPAPIARDDPVVAMDPRVELHHWLVIASLKRGDSVTALHQVEHIIRLVDGEHRREMRAAADEIERGDLHLAEHIIEGMLSRHAPSPLSTAQLHLRLALESLGVGDIEAAQHHFEHAQLTTPGLAVDWSAHRVGDEGLVDLVRSAVSWAIDQDLGVEQCWRSHQATATRQLRVQVGLDDSWLSHHGAAAVDEAERILRDSANVLGEADVAVIVTGWFEWTSLPAVDKPSLRVVLRRLRADVDADLVVMMTARDLLGTDDGWHVPEIPAVVVRHHDNHGEDALVLVHEIGHYLGMMHRPGTYMQAIGFPPVPVWSNCQSGE